MIQAKVPTTDTVDCLQSLREVVRELEEKGRDILALLQRSHPPADTSELFAQVLHLNKLHLKVAGAAAAIVLVHSGASVVFGRSRSLCKAGGRGAEKRIFQVRWTMALWHCYRCICRLQLGRTPETLSTYSTFEPPHIFKIPE